MAREQVKKGRSGVTLKGVEKLMSRQTGVILDAVDKRFQAVDIRFDAIDDRFRGLEIRMDRMEKSMEELRNTLDKFLKRLTDFSDEFKIVKARLAKVEKILQEKLGVTID